MSEINIGQTNPRMVQGNLEAEKQAPTSNLRKTEMSKIGYTPHTETEISSSEVHGGSVTSEIQAMMDQVKGSAKKVTALCNSFHLNSSDLKNPEILAGAALSAREHLKACFKELSEAFKKNSDSKIS